jgi:electron transfer flavoprotein alpha subunit
MGDVLAVVEQREGKIRGVSYEIVSTAARIAGDLGGKAHALVLGPEGISGAVGDLGRFGADTVKAGEASALSAYHPEGYAQAVAGAVRSGGYEAVFFPATAQGKDLSPRVAALLDVPMAADVTDLRVEDGGVVAIRPVFSGKAFATTTFSASPALLSIRPNAFSAQENPAAGTVETFSPEGVDPGSWKVRVKEFQATGGGSKDVAEASIVVTGGRGMKGPENWGMLEDLRDALGEDAALGASRAVVDAGWRPHAEQVGQTGKTVAPKLYFALGISGAIQHLAGMRTSQTIVAVNKDPDAPIFQAADYGIVGDVFDVVPRLAEEVRKLKAGD